MLDAPSVALAFAAGTVSFLSPCCLPLVPGYLATVCGKPIGERRFDPAVLARSLAFVGAFSAVFILLGLSATALGSLLRDNQDVLQKISGVVIIALGLFFLGHRDGDSVLGEEVQRLRPGHLFLQKLVGPVPAHGVGDLLRRAVRILG